ncbi:MAG: hypothetical protein ACREQ2_28795 [Candidatus Binatia bacterium]
MLNAKVRKLSPILAFALLLAGCSREGDAPQKDSGSAAASFVNKVWQVSSSSGVAAGTLYVFLSEGTLLITSPNSKPALGTWKYGGGALTLVEEGIAYKTDILRLTASEFQIRSNNRGQPVETTLVPAESHPVSK